MKRLIEPADRRLSCVVRPEEPFLHKNLEIAPVLDEVFRFDTLVNDLRKAIL